MTWSQDGGAKALPWEMCGFQTRSENANKVVNGI